MVWSNLLLQAKSAMSSDRLAQGIVQSDLEIVQAWR